jgi:hypothetical protein
MKGLRRLGLIVFAGLVATALAGADATPRVSAMFLGPDRTCARRVDGVVACWGRNDDGQLGDGTTTNRPTPVIIPELAGATVALGARHGCALRPDGGVACWGENSLGEIGDGTTEARSRPTAVAGLSGIVQVAVADGLSCARRADGAVLCWGGFLPTWAPAPDECGGGHRFYACARRPLVIPELTDVVELALAHESGCARRRAGAVACWGGAYGRAGIHPVALGPVVALEVDDERVCAVQPGGTIACVGANYDGQLGDGSHDNRATPVAVRGVTGAVELALGRLHSCARLRAGAVWCWGHDYGGELGDGKGGVARPRAGPVVGLPPARALVARHHRTCVIAADATVWCWGANDLGALGRDDLGGSATPLQVPGLDHVQALALDTFHACALRDDGSLRCWGSDRHGQLGDGGIADHRPPVAVRW